MKQLNYIDLFAGAGGLSEGFIRAGFKPIAHVEMNKNACDTFKTRTAYHWLKDLTRQEIIIKTQISNKGNFGIYANYYNLMDKKGVGFQLSKDSDLPNEKLFRKNDFEYIVFDLSGQREFFILPNENIVEYTNRVVSKIDVCKTEKQVLDLLVEEM